MITFLIIELRILIGKKIPSLKEIPHKIFEVSSRTFPVYNA